MKITNFKTKLIARIMLLVLLLASALSFAGCTIYAYNPKYYDHKYSKYNSFHSSYVFSAVTSDTNTFISDDVSFDFRYGFMKLVVKSLVIFMLELKDMGRFTLLYI